MALNKAWVKIKNRASSDFVKGVDEFLDFAFTNVREEARESATIRCPCDKCRNILFSNKCDVRLHLFKWGMYKNYTFWELHGEKSNESCDEGNVNESDDIDSGIIMLQDACGVGGMNLGGHRHVSNSDEESEEPNAKAKKFYQLLEEYRVPLTSNGETMSKLSYLVKLLHLKVFLLFIVVGFWSIEFLVCLCVWIVCLQKLEYILLFQWVLALFCQMKAGLVLFFELVLVLFFFFFATSSSGSICCGFSLLSGFGGLLWAFLGSFFRSGLYVNGCVGTVQVGQFFFGSGLGFLDGFSVD